MKRMSKDTLAARVSGEKADRVDEFREERGYDTISDALEELINIGLRESDPFLSRVKDLALEAAWYFSLTSVVIMVVGYLTTLVEPGQSLVIGFTLLTVAIAPISIIESIRIVKGRSEIRDQYRSGSDT